MSSVQSQCFAVTSSAGRMTPRRRVRDQQVEPAEALGGAGRRAADRLGCAEVRLQRECAAALAPRRARVVSSAASRVADVADGDVGALAREVRRVARPMPRDAARDERERPQPLTRVLGEREPVGRSSAARRRVGSANASSVSAGIRPSLGGSPRARSTTAAAVVGRRARAARRRAAPPRAAGAPQRLRRAPAERRSHVGGRPQVEGVERGEPLGVVERPASHDLAAAAQRDAPVRAALGCERVSSPRQPASSASAFWCSQVGSSQKRSPRTSERLLADAALAQRHHLSPRAMASQATAHSLRARLTPGAEGSPPSAFDVAGPRPSSSARRSLGVAAHGMIPGQVARRAAPRAAGSGRRSAASPAR